LFDRSIKRTTNPFEVESNVKNFTFISIIMIPLLSYQTLGGPRRPQ
jgi:nitrate reductase NapE component